MEALAIDPVKQKSSDIKNELIDQAVSSPTKLPVKTSGVINSNARYL